MPICFIPFYFLLHYLLGPRNPSGRGHYPFREGQDFLRRTSLPPYLLPMSSLHPGTLHNPGTKKQYQKG
jgi:hypothetical protein